MKKSWWERFKEKEKAMRTSGGPCMLGMPAEYYASKARSEEAENALRVMREISTKMDEIIELLKGYGVLLEAIRQSADSIDDSTWRAPR